MDAAVEQHRPARADPAVGPGSLLGRGGPPADGLGGRAEHAVPEGVPAPDPSGHEGLVALLDEPERLLELLLGSKDAQYGKARKQLPRRYPASTVRIWDGYGHCEYPAKKPEGFVREIMAAL